MKFKSKEIILTLICCFVLGNTVSGQGLKAQKDSLVLFKWDVSLDVLNLFKGYRGVMIRYAPGSRGAFRLAISSLSHSTDEHFQYYDTTGTVPQHQLYKRKTFNLSTLLGYERRKDYGRHQLFYGMDIGVDYNWAREYIVTLYPAKVYSIGVHPFVGLKYRVSNRLSISAEALFTAQRKIVKNFGPRNIVASKSNSYGFALDPLRLINISYHF
ncbi:hypothetical protein [Dyadobacter sp. 32]|uniref:hypothetical protein n=1 Tax=Dyadobacter sp. 32 TaxID=538966 RepID=UPI0011EEBEED